MSFNLLKTLLKVRFTNEFKLNQIVNKNHRNSHMIMMLISILILITTVIMSLTLFTSQLVQFGLGQWIPLIYWLMCHILLLIFNAFIIYPNFFDFQDFDLLRSLPIRLSTILVSRFLFWYLIEAVLVFTICIVPLLSFGYALSLVPFSLVWLLLLSSIAPAVTIALSLLACGLALKVSQHFKRSKTVYNLLNLSVILLIAVIPIITTIKLVQLDLSTMLSGANIIYLLIRLENITIPFTNLTSILSWLLISLVIVFGSLTYLIYDFNQLNVRLHNNSLDQVKSQKKQRTVMSALIHKELRLFLNVSVYLFNTAIIIITVPIAVSILFFLPENIVDLIRLGIQAYLPLLPIILAGTLALMNTTSVSLSLEGKHINSLSALPIGQDKIYQSKVYFNHILFIPPTLLSCMMLIIVLELGLMDSFFLILVPVLMVVFSGWVGMLFNSLFQNYLWDNETQVVKQSVPVLLSLLTLIAVSIVGGFMVISWEQVGLWLFIGLLIFLIFLSKSILYKQPIKSI